MHRTFGLVGFPLGHSFSRQFFTEKFAAEKLDAQYLNFEIPTLDLLPEKVLAIAGLVGFNVTIPYKEKIIPHLHQIDNRAEAIGAVNTVRVERASNGSLRLTGFNTDASGFQRSIAPRLRQSDISALVLGSGGASKAVVYALKELGLDTVVVSRTPGSGQIGYDGLSRQVMTDHTVIVNTTPLGMYPHVETCPPIPYLYLTEGHLCFDIVYNPEMTLFLRKAAEHGCRICGGKEMLINQALDAWDIWNRN